MKQIKNIFKLLNISLLISILAYSCNTKTVTIESLVKASVDSVSGQIIIEEEGKKVLQYNYQTVFGKNL